MSLSGALSNAMSGLSVNALGTSVVSSNIANAMNEEYGVRDLLVAANAVSSHGGATALGVVRNVDRVTTQLFRDATAFSSNKAVFADFAVAAERHIGSIDEAGGLSDRLTDFETALISAVADPGSELRLRKVALAAQSLSDAFNNASSGIQDLRSVADNEINLATQNINRLLSEIDGLNKAVVMRKHYGGDHSSLLDQRDAALSKLSGYIPLRVVERESGSVSVFSKGGKTLLDGKPAKFEFSRTPVIMPHMTFDNSLLSGLTIDGVPVNPSMTGMIGGGSLSAHFDVRDVHSVEKQNALDALARDLVERFDSNGPDPTLATGDPGVFTDLGASFLPANESGLSGRLSLNGLLDANSSELWRWRTGLSAAAPGDAGDGSLLIELRGALHAQQAPGNPTLGSGARSFISLIHDQSDRVVFDRVAANEAADTARQSLAEISEEKARSGVNTDQELQKLIELEKNYAANARVIQVVDEMIEDLLGI